MYCFIIYLAGVAISRFGSDDKIPADDFNKNRVCAVLPRCEVTFRLLPSPRPLTVSSCQRNSAITKHVFPWRSLM